MFTLSPQFVERAMWGEKRDHHRGVRRWAELPTGLSNSVDRLRCASPEIQIYSCYIPSLSI
jgi:hypothetical protein